MGDGGGGRGTGSGDGSEASVPRRYRETRRRGDQTSRGASLGRVKPSMARVGATPGIVLTNP